MNNRVTTWGHLADASKIFQSERAWEPGTTFRKGTDLNIEEVYRWWATGTQNVWQTYVLSTLWICFLIAVCHRRRTSSERFSWDFIFFVARDHDCRIDSLSQTLSPVRCLSINLAWHYQSRFAAELFPRTR